MLTRRALFSLPAAGLLSGGYAFGVEPRWFDTVIQPVAIPGLANPVRLLHLSDLHVSRPVPLALIESAVEMGIATKPDLICLTGDFITQRERLNWGEYSRVLQRLSSAAPTFAVLGNHDGGFWAHARGGHRDPSEVVKLLRASGATLLHNASELLQVRGAALRVTGLGDLWSKEMRPNRAFPADDPENVPSVLLAHNPDTKDAVLQYRWDLMLSGHTHGGQVLIPLVGDSFAPVRDRRFVAGLKQWNDRQIYITRGVGSLAGIRFNCRPEVTVLDLSGAAPAIS